MDTSGVLNVVVKRNKLKRGNGDDVNANAAERKKQRQEKDHSALEPDRALLESKCDTASDTNEYPYHVVPDDHCETPMEAYQDISSFLDAIAGQLGKTRETLHIFDPYFCEGSMKARLGSLRFTNVSNEKRDFYESIRNGTLPQFDVLVTNPPYSGDHMEKLLRFCTGEQCRRPWFLLMPNYVYTKDYYGEIVGGAAVSKKMSQHTNPAQPATVGAVVQQTHRLPFYVIPAGNRRYLYTTPKGRRQEKSAKYTSPFPTFWYCQVYDKRESVLSQAAAARVRAVSEGKSIPAIVVAISSAVIPLEHAPDNDPRKKKLRNNLKRTKNKKRKKGGAGNGH